MPQPNSTTSRPAKFDGRARDLAFGDVPLAPGDLGVLPGARRPRVGVVRISAGPELAPDGD